jgi:RNA polymerase-binding transcription factor DksA
LESDYIQEEQKQKVKEHLASLDPFQLSKKINRKNLRIKVMAKGSFEDGHLLTFSEAAYCHLSMRHTEEIESVRITHRVGRGQSGLCQTAGRAIGFQRPVRRTDLDPHGISRRPSMTNSQGASFPT